MCSVMTVSAQIMEERTVNEIRAALLGRRCWNVACGGCVGASFQLALGGKVRRERLLRNPTVSEEYRRFEGEFGLMVWCTWRLENGKGPMTSWEDESPQRDEALRGLVGKTVSRVRVQPGWDLQVVFSGGAKLSVFPDHVGQSAIFDGNWEVWSPQRVYAVGTSLQCESADREKPVAPATASSVVGRRRRIAPARRPKRIGERSLGLIT